MPSSLRILTLAPVAWAATTIVLPNKPPSGAYTIDPSFPNLSYEFGSLLLFAQTDANDTSPNQFSINLMNSIYQRSGGHPILRVGGTTGDFYSYLPSQETPVVPIPAYGIGQDTFNTTIGHNFWPVTANLASTGATWIPQISLASNNLTAVEEQAQAAVDGIGWSLIDSIDLGNEPGFYPNDQSTDEYSAPLNNTSYAARFTKYASSIAASIGASEPVFQAGDFANGDDSISVGAVLRNNITSGGNIKSFANHYYQLIGEDDLYENLLNHSKTTSQLEITRDQLRDLETNTDPLIPLILDEVNVITGGNNYTVTQSLGASIWMVDFMLYCMTIGVKRVHWESVYASFQATWTPSTTGPKPAGTGAGFYALPPTAEFIGLTNGTSKVSQVAVNGTIDNPYFTAYASFNDSALARVALVNLQPWSSGGTAERPMTTVLLDGLDTASHLTVKYLTSPGGAHGQNTTLTYGGSQWTWESQGKEVTGVTGDTVEVAVCDGSAEVLVPATSVAMVFLTPN